jgi:DNA-binding CsgD family transcriptional regulator
VLERTIRAAARSHRVQHVEFEVPGEHAGLYEARCLPFADGALLLILRDLKAKHRSDGDERRGHLREVVNNEERVEPTRANPYGLTHRELAVLQLVVQGMADKQIADALGISIYTVNKHVGNILGKMNAVSRTEAGVRAIKEGLLTPELRDVAPDDAGLPRRPAA